MLSQHVIRFNKRKVIGGSFLGNVYDKVKNVISTGSKILNRIPTGMKSEIKKAVTPLLKNATTKTMQPVKKLLGEDVSTTLSDRSRAILSNLIAGSGFKNYM